MHLKIRNLKEQLTNTLLLSNNEMQIENDLKKKRSSQEETDLQEQPKSALHQIKSKVCCTCVCSVMNITLCYVVCNFLKNRHCTSLTNELKNLRHDHQNMVIENNNLISKFTQELHDTENNKLSYNNDNFNGILNLISQLVECSIQNQLLNDELQKLKVNFYDRIIFLPLSININFFFFF